MRGSKLIRVTPGTTTHYQRLGVAPTATQPEIRAAYRDLARLHHPDVSDADADAAMVAVNEAWYVLRDPARRAAYDATMRSARPTPPESPPPRAESPRAPADPSADEPRPRPAWWNEPLTDDPRLDVPLTDGRAVRTFAFLVAIAASLAIAALTALFAYAILWSN